MINNLKDLSKLITLCRKTGVSSIRVEGIELHLGAEPNKGIRQPKMGKISATPQMADKEQTIDEILSDGLTEDQLLYYSVTSQPDSSAAEQN